MNRLGAALLTLLLSAGPALAAGTFSSFPNATVPLTGTEEVPLDQGSGCALNQNPCATVRVSPLRLGQPLAQPTQPPTPYLLQAWWNTGTTPYQYNIYNGTTWVPVYQIDPTTGIASFPSNFFLPNGNILVGQVQGSSGVQPNWPITVLGNNTVSAPTGMAINGYENGTGVVGAAFRGYTSRGPYNAATAVQSGDLLAAFRGGGFWAGKPNNYYIANDDRGAIEVHAGENWIGASNNGTFLTFSTTQSATNTMVERARLDGFGNWGLGTPNPVFKSTMLANNPIPSGSLTQGYNVNTRENGSGLTGSAFRGWTSRGTTLAPTAVVTNDNLMTVGSSGYWTGKVNPYWDNADANGRATIGMYAAENWVGSGNNGAYMTFGTTAAASGSLTERMRIQASGGVSIGTTTDPGLGSLLVSGSVQSPSVTLTCTVFASVPASPTVGAVACVTDSTVNTWGTTIAGSGTNKVLAFYDGSVWTVAAK